MDIVGVAGVAAEAELLAAICALLQRLGLGAADVVVKVSSRGVLAAVLGRAGVPAGALGAVAVVVDKLDKLPRAKARREGFGVGLVGLLQGFQRRARAAARPGRVWAGARDAGRTAARGASRMRGGLAGLSIRGADLACKGGGALAPWHNASCKPMCVPGGSWQHCCRQGRQRPGCEVFRAARASLRCQAEPAALRRARSTRRRAPWP